MYGSSTAGNGPLGFRIVIQEANGVPKDFSQLRVLWQKGVQEISTELALVREVNNTLRAEWNATLQIQCTCFRASDGSLKAKQCWLQVLSGLHKNSVVGYAQLDLAELSDGRVHSKALRVRSSDPDPTKAAAMQSMKLNVTVEAAAQALPAQSSIEGMPSSPTVEQPPLAKDISDVIMNELDRMRANSTTFSPSGNHEPISPRFSKSPWGDEPDTPRGPFPATLTGGSSYVRSRIGSLEIQPDDVRSSVTEVSPLSGRPTRFLTNLENDLGEEVVIEKISDLRGRLSNLVWSECSSSGLHWQEQEDALWLLAADLRQQQSLSCGLVFSCLPGAESRLSANLANGSRRQFSILAEREEDSWPMRNLQSDPRDVRQVVSREDTSNVLYQAPASTILFPSPRKLDPPTPGDSLHPVMEHAQFQEELRRLSMEQQQLLSDVRLQMMALISRESDFQEISQPKVHYFSGSDHLMDQALEVGSSEPGQSGPVVASIQQPECSPARLPRASEDPPGQKRKEDRSGSGSAGSSQSRASSKSNSETFQDQAARRTSDLAKHIDSLVRNIDQASDLGERVLEDVAAELNNLLRQIHELSNDRQIWADQFLALRDLQRLGELCTQASACA